MRPSVALDLKRSEIRAAIRRFRAANPRVYGSVVHGTDDENSDLDILVDPVPNVTSLFDLGALQIELENVTRVRVDVKTPGDLPPHIRAKVLAEARAL